MTDQSPEAAPISPPSSWLDQRPQWQVTLGVLIFGLLLYVPFAGSYGLWDPWETHYGEVARQMAMRNDFISLWWAGSPLDVGDYFWSKPVLTFWILCLSFKLFGVGTGAPGEMALDTRTEWAMRLPFALMALMAIYGVYLMASRFVSRRAGILAAVALGTMPLFGLVARNAMTDMPFVGPMTLALALGALALFDSDDTPLPRRHSRLFARLTWPHHPLFYGTVALFVIVVLPQILAISLQLRWTPFRDRARVVPGFVTMLPYVFGFIGFLWLATTTRYKAPFYLYLAAILCGLAVLAKGLAGLGLPVIVFLAYLLFTWNWARLGRAQLPRAVLVSLLGCAVVAVPWHHAMLVRHGFPFWDELYGDNHWRRLVSGRHGDRGTFEYFLRELGYATLPWVALLPSALAWVLMRPFRNVKPNDFRREIYWFGAIWFVAAYAIVSLSMTKFHHYILPGLPGLALVLGCFLDDVATHGRRHVARASAITGLPLLAVITHDLVNSPQSAQYFIWLFSYDYVNTPLGRPWPADLDFRAPIIALATGCALLTFAWAFIPKLRHVGPLLLGLVAVAFTVFILDVYAPKTAAHWSQKPLIASYYKMRRSPQERLIAWQMYWRGETFYTKNEIFEGPLVSRTVFLGDRNVEQLKEWIGRNRGHRAFFIVEQGRLGSLRGNLPPETQASLRIVDERNNKFYLAQADL